jgi:elongation factor Ts
MATITPALVNELRAKTGLGIMECKKLLSEADGDVAKAVQAAREKGVKTSITERAATEGRVHCDSNGTVAAAVEINCNTDFTAKSDTVLAVLKLAVGKLLANPSAALADDAEVGAALKEAAQTTGENVVLGKNAVVTGGSGTGAYLYSTAGKGKVAVLVQFAAGGNEELAKQLGMQIAAARPVALTRDQVPADLVASERAIAVEQAKQTGKPQQIAEKIAEGKLSAFYAERVLLDQEFFNADQFKGKVGDLLKSKGATVAKYVRLEVGVA